METCAEMNSESIWGKPPWEAFFILDDGGAVGLRDMAFFDEAKIEIIM